MRPLILFIFVFVALHAAVQVERVSFALIDRKVKAIDASDVDSLAMEADRCCLGKWI